MNDGILDKKAFAAIHDLKKDAAQLSRHIDRIADITTGNDTPDRESVIKAFLAEYEAFLTKYENSVNEKIKAFVVEIKGIVIGHKAELAGVGLDVSREGSLYLPEEGCLIKGGGLELADEATVYEVLNEALLNAEVHMERFIPEKYLSYDKQRDYRILKQEGNIYTREI